VTADKPRIGIIIGTIREGRFGDTPAAWIHALGAKRDDLAFETVDLRDYRLPPFGQEDDTGSSARDVERWRARMDELDGYIFVTAEYNHSISNALKNALDHTRSEYARKPAAFIGYGGVGGARAVEHLRLIAIEMHLSPLRNAVHIGMDVLLAIANEGKRLDDYDFLITSAALMLDDLAWWTYALRAGRGPALAAAPISHPTATAATAS
jgi:NAD(P)H-dependent FMN reductase